MRLQLVTAALALFAAVAHAQPTPPAQEVRVRMNWQTHPAMHLPWRFFSKGLRDGLPTSLTYRHMFKQVVYAPAMKASGVRIFGAAAMAAERAENPRQARQLILDQLAFVNAFVAAHPDEYAIARTPAEARRILATTTKMVIVHQIEGGRKILQQPGDAAFWRSQGVSLITLIHLLDDELGGSAVNPGILGKLLNIGASLHPKRRRGLTARGKQAIVEMARAGIILDLSHMSPGSTDDALAVCRQHRIPPVVTHGAFRPVQDSQRALSEAQMLEVYRLGGIFCLPVDGGEWRNPTVAIPPGLVAGTQDALKLNVEVLHGFLRDHAVELLGRPWAQTSSAERTRLSIGWASDWNGWTNHSKPTPRRPGFPSGPALEVDRVGLAHPGLLPQYFQRLRESGLDLEPLDRASERFLQIWERVQASATP